MNLLDSKLDTLLAVNEYKSFTIAAKELNLTQPAVSQHIANLESEFDIKIFKKTGTTLLLTNEGEILVKYARRMKAISKELESKLQEERSGPSLLRVGITHSLEGNVLPEVFANIASQNSRTTIKIYSDDIKNLYDKLSNYEIDLAIIEGKMNVSKFSKVLLDTDHVMLIMSKENPLAKKPIVTIEDIKKQNLIFRHSKSATRSLFLDNLERINVLIDELSILLEIDNTATIKDLIKKNKGVAVLPKSICMNEIKSKTLVAKPIKDMDLTTEINLVYNKKFFSEEIIKAIINAYENILDK